MSMYERGYVLVWADTVTDAIGLLQRGQFADAILLENARENDVECLRRSFTRSPSLVKIGAIVTGEEPIDPSGWVDFIVRDAASHQEIGSALDRLLKF